MFIITVTLRRLRASWKRFVLFLGLAALLCTAAGLAGSFFLSGGGPDPVRLLVVNEDDSMESRLMYNILSTSEAYAQVFTLELAGLDSAMEELEAGRASAVAVLPPGFVESVKYGENLPVTMIYSRAAPLKSLLVSTFADAFADMLRTSQVGVYTALDFAREAGTPEQYEELFLQVNIGYLRRVLERDRAFQPAIVSATGRLSFAAYYAVHAAVFLLLLLPVLLLDLLRAGLSPYLVGSLRRMGTGPLQAAGGVWLGGWLYCAGLGCAAWLILDRVVAALGRTLPLAVLPAVLAVLALTLSLSLLAALLFRGAAAGCLLLSAFSLLSLFLAGGIIPADYLAPGLGRLALLTPHHWAFRLLGAAAAGQSPLAALPAVLGYALLLFLPVLPLLRRGQGDGGA